MCSNRREYCNGANWKCIVAPPTIIDYIVHELCHFHHLDHTEAFWNEVDKIVPDYF